jgi:hypothetical protein
LKINRRHVRGAKFEHYSKLDSLREYLLVAQNRPRLELFTKPSVGRWLPAEFESLDEVLKLASINGEPALKDVHLKINFQEAGKLREPAQKPQ